MYVCEPDTRADDVGKLIAIAMDCGYPKNTALFDKILDRLYPNNAEPIGNIADSFMKCISQMIETRDSCNCDTPCETKTE